MAVYQLAGRTGEIGLLHVELCDAFPKAKFSGGEPGQFVAWASAKDHEGIKALFERLNAKPPPEDTEGDAVHAEVHHRPPPPQVLRTAVPRRPLPPTPTTRNG